MKILAIETSCDETAVAILEITKSKQKPVFRLLSNIVSSQVKIHKPFGGVVPNLAMREHQRNSVPVLIKSLKEAKLLKSKIKNKKIKLQTKNEKIKKILERERELLKLVQKHILRLKPPSIDAIAVTVGPGLEPALWVGINFARALAALWNKPLISVNHLEGHIYASWLPAHESTKHEIRNSKQTLKNKSKKPELTTTNYKQPAFPLLALIVSGGHTELVLMKKHLDYEVLGETRDDAAGEAFDKVAKMLGLGYPGGPEIARLAEKGNYNAILFPRPMINSKNYDFSFSGLKTAVFYYLKRVRLPLGSRTPKLQNIAASFEQAVIDVLASKTNRALRQYGASALGHYGIRSLVVGGGVAANKKLRSSLKQLVTSRHQRVALYLSPLWLCGDNAAMIAVAAYFKARKKNFSNSEKIRAGGNLKLKLKIE